MNQGEQEIRIEYFGSKKNNKKPKQNRYKTAREYLIYLVNFKDYSTGELRFKASQKGYPNDDVEIVIQRFVDTNLVNDQRLRERLIEKYTGKKDEAWIRNKLWQRKLHNLE